MDDVTWLQILIKMALKWNKYEKLLILRDTGKIILSLLLTSFPEKRSGVSPWELDFAFLSKYGDVIWMCLSDS